MEDHHPVELKAGQQNKNEGIGSMTVSIDLFLLSLDLSITMEKQIVGLGDSSHDGRRSTPQLKSGFSARPGRTGNPFSQKGYQRPGNSLPVQGCRSASGQFATESCRGYAVDCLRAASDIFLRRVHVNPKLQQICWCFLVLVLSKPCLSSNVDEKPGLAALTADHDAAMAAFGHAIRAGNIPDAIKVAETLSHLNLTLISRLDVLSRKTDADELRQTTELLLRWLGTTYIERDNFAAAEDSLQNSLLLAQSLGRQDHWTSTDIKVELKTARQLKELKRLSNQRRPELFSDHALQLV